MLARWSIAAGVPAHMYLIKIRGCIVAIRENIRSWFPLPSHGAKERSNDATLKVAAALVDPKVAYAPPGGFGTDMEQNTCWASLYPLHSQRLDRNTGNHDGVGALVVLCRHTFASGRCRLGRYRRRGVSGRLVTVMFTQHLPIGALKPSGVRRNRATKRELVIRD